MINRWVRNSEWLNIDTPLDTEEKCIILKAVFDSTQEWAALSATGDYTVNWGDGNIENFASGATAEHTYNYADVGLYDSSVELGYKQTIIQVYPQVGQQLTSLNFQKKHTNCAGSGIYDTRFLDVRMAGVNLTDLVFAATHGDTPTVVVMHSIIKQFSLGLNSITDFSNTLSGCFSLRNIPSFYASNGITHKNLFNYTGIKYIPKNFDTPVSLNLAGLFSNCVRLVSIPSHVTYNAITLANYVSSCYRLEDIPTINLLSCTDAQYFAYNCRQLKKIKVINSHNCQNFTAFARDCASLTELHIPSFAAATTMTTLVYGCPNLDSVDLPQAAPILIDNAFAYTFMATLPGFDSANVTNANSLLFSNRNVTEINLDLGLNQNFNNLLYDCKALRRTNIINASSGTSFTSMYVNCGNLEYSILQGCRYTVSITNCNFPKENIEAFLAALGSAATGTQTVTISGNPGTGIIYSKTATTTTLGSKTVTVADTSNINIGDRMTGTGSPLTTAIAITFTDVGDTVNLVNHQLLDNDLVSFVSITTTTGIVVRTPYYVVNKTTDNFQLSLTQGGAPITLTNNGSGTMIYDSVIESIDPNVSITLSRPATSTSASTKSFRSLNTAPAILKGFTISG